MTGTGEKAAPLLKEELTAARAVIAALADAGIELVLGMPGGYVGALFSALHEHPTIRVVQVREEHIGSIAAEAYGRLRGRPAVICGQGEWISGNAGAGLLEALLGSSPVLALTEMSDGGVLSHHGYYQSGTGDHGSWDARSALSGVSKRVLVANDPVQAVQQTQLAIKHATSGAPGPVSVIFHSRALEGRVGPDAFPRLYSSSYYLSRGVGVDDAAMAGAIDALRAAERPVIIAGNGVRVGQACDGLLAAARALDVPVATTAGGKGVFPETDPLAVGVMGTFGFPTANAIVQSADVVLAVGTKLAPIDTGDETPALLDPARQTLVQIDIEPLNASWTYPADHVVVGPAAQALDRIATAFELNPPSRQQTGTDRVADAFSQHAPVDTEEFSSNELPMHPQRIIRLIEELWPANGVVTNDAGENRLFMLHWFRSSFPDGGYLMPAGGGGMGYALPAALGAKLAFPDRPALAVCGDGGFAVSLTTLMSAVQAKIPIAVVVFNNAALGWIVHGMGKRAVAGKFEDFDHAAISRAMGCEGVRVSSIDELRDALVRAGTSEVPFVIDVPTNMQTSFKDVVQPISSDRWKAGD